MQHEGETLRRCQPVEHDEQREPYRIRKERFLLGAAPALTCGDRLRCAWCERLLTTRLARPQYVEAHTRNDRGQPSAKVVDTRGISSAESQPRFLNRVIDLPQRAKHPVRHGEQAG